MPKRHQEFAVQIQVDDWKYKLMLFIALAIREMELVEHEMMILIMTSTLTFW